MWGPPGIDIGLKAVEYHFISDLDDGTKCTLMNFANDIKVSREVDASEGRATLQEDLDRLEEWANKSLMKFNKENVRTCTWQNIIQQCGTGWDLPRWTAALWKGTWGSWWTINSI